MAIHIVYGPGGAGKSLYQLTEILIPQLRETKRNIITNLPLNLGRLNEYLEQKYPGENLRPLERIRVLTTKECGTFWRIRGPLKWTLGTHPVNCYACPDMVEDVSPYGVCYIIDEAGDVGFSAVAWAENIGRSSRAVECLHYLDQQRKHSDDSFFSTNGRAPGAIAKGFRDKAHFFIKLKNNRLAILGPFRGSDDFRWEKYTMEPTPSNGAEPVAAGKFVLDAKGSASCYRTQDGNGVQGNGADIGARAKGWSIYWVFPIFIGISSLAFVIPWALGHGTKAMIGAKVDSKKPALHVNSQNTKPEVVPASKVYETPAPGLPGLAQSAEVTCTGYMIKGKEVAAFLSDGGSLHGSEILGISKTHVFASSGKRYRLKTQRDPRPTVANPDGLGGSRRQFGETQQGAGLEPRTKLASPPVSPAPPVAPGKQVSNDSPSVSGSPFKPNPAIGGPLGSRQ